MSYYVDDGRMTPKCVSCPYWHDKNDGDGGRCDNPYLLECPYFRKELISLAKKGERK